MNAGSSIGATEIFMERDLIKAADWACKAAFPDEIKDALAYAEVSLLFVCVHQLREVTHFIVAVNVTLVVYIGLIPATWLSNTLITLIEGHDVTCMLFRLVSLHIQDAAAQIFKHPVVILLTFSR